MSLSKRDLRIDAASQLVLAGAVRLDGGWLLDQSSGVRHELNTTAAYALSELNDGNTFGEVARAIASLTNADLDLVQADLRQLLVALDRYDLIEDRTARTGYLARCGQAVRHPEQVAISAWLWATTAPTRRIGRRYEATLSGIARAAGRACGPVLAWTAGAIMAATVYATVARPSLAPTPAAIHFLLTMMAALAIYVFLAIVHECSHLLAMRLTKTSCFYVAQSGWTVSLAHAGSTLGTEILIGVAGPIGAASAGFALGLLLLALFGDPLGLYANIGSLTAVLGATHLLNLGPWSADGRPLWTLLLARPLRRKHFVAPVTGAIGKADV